MERFDRAEAEASDGSFIEYLPQQIEKLAARRKIASPGDEIDAAKNDLLVAPVGEIVNFVDDFFRRKAAAFSANEGDYAEGTAVVATVLNF